MNRPQILCTHKRKMPHGLCWHCWQAAWEEQGGCAICKRNDHVEDLFVDHDHATGMIRGLLCRRCNTGLGFFKDNPAALREAAKYVEEAPEWTPEGCL